MGACFSACSKEGQQGEQDVASLIKTENMSTEAMTKSAVPPAPLLKEINFAAIEDGDEGEEDDTDLDDGEFQQLLDEEAEDAAD